MRSTISRSASASATRRNSYVLEVAQAAVDQLGRGRMRWRTPGRLRSTSSHRQPAAGGVARDAGAVDAAADHQQVVDHFHASGMRTPSATPSPSGRFDAAMVPPWNSAISRATYSPSPRCGVPARARFAHRDHRLEQAGAHLFGQRRALVRHGERRGAARCLERDAHRRCAAREVHRVLHQLVEQLRGEVGRAFHLDAAPGRQLERESAPADRRADSLRRSRAPPRPGQSARARPRAGSAPGATPRSCARGCDRGAPGPARRARCRRAAPPPGELQVLERRAHHGDRRAQLVRQAPGHALQVGVVLGEALEHRGEAARQVADLVAPRSEPAVSRVTMRPRASIADSASSRRRRMRIESRVANAISSTAGAARTPRASAAAAARARRCAPTSPSWWSPRPPPRRHLVADPDRVRRRHHDRAAVARMAGARRRRALQRGGDLRAGGEHVLRAAPRRNPRSAAESASRRAGCHQGASTATSAGRRRLPAAAITW